MDITPRIVAYVASQEGLVPEAYKDIAGVWTWSAGITAASGIDVMRYKDSPASLHDCLIAAVTLMQTKYLPPIAKAFSGHDLTEIQLAVALSFQWHYGEIMQAQWVKDWCVGKPASAKADFMQWTDHGRAFARAKVEQSMFFGGAWPAVILVPVYAVAKPSYMPVRAVMTNVMPMLQQIMGGPTT